MAILDFSVSGWHGFGSVTQVCFGISVSNFMCMYFVAVGRSLTFVSYVAFKMAALWFWTMFNCKPPIAHCHPLLWGGGILVDHWSTISSFSLMHNEFNVYINIKIYFSLQKTTPCYKPFLLLGIPLKYDSYECGSHVGNVCYCSAFDTLLWSKLHVSISSSMNLQFKGQCV